MLKQSYRGEGEEEKAFKLLLATKTRNLSISNKLFLDYERKPLSQPRDVPYAKQLVAQPTDIVLGTPHLLAFCKGLLSATSSCEFHPRRPSYLTTSRTCELSIFETLQETRGQDVDVRACRKLSLLALKRIQPMD